MKAIKKLLAAPRHLAISAFVSSVLFAETALAGAPGAGGFAKVTTTLDRVQNLLTVAGVTVVTIAIMMAGYKMAFAGAGFKDVTGLLIGGTLIGGSVAMAGFIVN